MMTTANPSGGTPLNDVRNSAYHYTESPNAAKMKWRVMTQMTYYSPVMVALTAGSDDDDDVAVNGG